MAPSQRDTPASSGGMHSPGSPFEAALEGTPSLSSRLRSLPHAARGGAVAAGQPPSAPDTPREAGGAPAMMWQEVEELACQLAEQDQVSSCSVSHMQATFLFCAAHCAD